MHTFCGHTFCRRHHSCCRRELLDVCPCLAQSHRLAGWLAVWCLPGHAVLSLIPLWLLALGDGLNMEGLCEGFGRTLLPHPRLRAGCGGPGDPAGGDERHLVLERNDAHRHRHCRAGRAPRQRRGIGGRELLQRPTGASVQDRLRVCSLLPRGLSWCAMVLSHGCLLH